MCEEYLIISELKHVAIADGGSSTELARRTLLDAHVWVRVLGNLALTWIFARAEIDFHILCLLWSSFNIHPKSWVLIEPHVIFMLIFFFDSK